MNFEPCINFFIKEEELSICEDKHENLNYDIENCSSDFPSSSIVRIKDENETEQDKCYFELPSNIDISNENYISNFDQIQENNEELSSTIPNNDSQLSTICGEIELNNGVFMFICKFCNKKFLALKLFMSHTLNIHLPPVNWSDEITQNRIEENNDDIDDDDDGDDDDDVVVGAQETVTNDNKIIKPMKENHDIDKEYLIKKIIQGQIKDLKIRIFKKADKKYHCPVCGYSSLVSNFLQSHFKVHFICETSNHFQCGYCNAFFARKSIYNTHVKSHTHPFKCCFCPFEFTSENKLKEHQRYHLSETKLKCQYCDKTFLLPGELNKHVKLSHTNQNNYIGITKKPSTTTVSKQTTDSTKPLWKCVKCGRNFKKKISLELHHFNTQNNCRNVQEIQQEY